jgi:serine/threonine protein kinase
MLMLLEACPGCGQQIEDENAAAGLCPQCLLRRGAALLETANLAQFPTPGESVAAFVPPDPVELEAELPGYDIYQLLGRGGMGAVYKARHCGLDRIVALKILPRTPGGQSFSVRFEREARALARLHHENIVMAFDFGVSERYAYCVMEYVDGPNVRELIELEGIEPRRAVEIARDVCQGLAYAHQAGVVHRDIKPENVLVGYDGRVKIADFGLAKLVTPHEIDLPLTRTRHFMGTVHYMAPEQVERPHLVDHRVDLYSTGVLLYEMLTCELPLGRFDAPSVLAGVDAGLDDIALKALEKDPARRYQSADELAGDCRRHLSASHAPRAPADNRGHGGVRRRLLVAGGLFGFIGLVLLGWQFLLEYNRDKDGTTKLVVKASGDNENGGQNENRGQIVNRGENEPQPSQPVNADLHSPIWEMRGHELFKQKLCGECHTPKSLGVPEQLDPIKKEKRAAEAISHQIDQIVRKKLDDLKLKKAPDDAEFIRRTWLDILGSVPSQKEISDFVNDHDARKRERLVYETWLQSHENAQSSPKGESEKDAGSNEPATGWSQPEAPSRVRRGQ